MAEFTYEALTSTGQRNKGSLVATSEREVMTMLDARGLFPLKIAPLAASGTTGVTIGRRVRPRYVARFFSQLADLLHSGVPLLRSIDIIEKQTTKPALAAVLREVYASVADGNGLAESMGQHPKVFTELSVSMVRAGQEGGFLEDVLRRIADFMEHQEDLKGQVIGALAYPLFLAAAGFLIVNILVIFFIPKFEPIFKRLEEANQLPVLTSVLIMVSHGMQRLGIPTGIFLIISLAYLGAWARLKALMADFANLPLWIYIATCGAATIAYLLLCPNAWVVTPGEGATFLTVLAAIFTFYWWSHTDSGRLTLDAVRLRIPKVGTLYLSFALSRFARILGTLLHNGIPILNALKVSKDSTGNKVLSNAIEDAAENITAGQSLAEPLSECKYFPRDVVAMIAVGEESNNLEKVLTDIAETTERRATRELQLFVRLLEPIMLLVMGAIVFIVAMGLLMPVFMMSSTVNQQH